MTEGYCLESTYKELKLEDTDPDTIRVKRLESTYKELKHAVAFVVNIVIDGLESTYKELKLVQPILAQAAAWV